MRASMLCAIGLAVAVLPIHSQTKFKVLVLGQPDNNHPQTGAAGIKAVQEIAAGQSYTVDAITDPAKLTDDFLAPYQVLMVVMGWQGDWTASERNAVQKFVEAGKGWMGFHVSTLAGIYTTPWPWYDTWVGSITFKGHPATRQDGLVKLESTALDHPVLAGLAPTLTLHEEWYAWTTSPRGKPDISILATVDETTYDPGGTAMGKDHPVIWSSTKYGPMILTSLGHEPEAYSNANMRKFIANAIPWLAKSSATAVYPTLAAPKERVTPVLRWDGHRLTFGSAGAFDASGRSFPLPTR